MHQKQWLAELYFLPLTEQQLFLTRSLTTDRNHVLVQRRVIASPHSPKQQHNNCLQPQTQIKMSRYLFHCAYDHARRIRRPIKRERHYATDSQSPTGIYWHSEWADGLSPLRLCTDPPTLTVLSQRTHLRSNRLPFSSLYNTSTLLLEIITCWV